MTFLANLWMFIKALPIIILIGIIEGLGQAVDNVRAHRTYVELKSKRK